MAIQSEWREQYERMLRSHSQLRGISTGAFSASSDEARDCLFHFFQDAYHLKDWIKNDPSIAPADAEGFINESEPLQICADLCNGTKHFLLRRSRTGDDSTAFTSQSVTVRPATVGSGKEADPALHGWTVETNGQLLDAVGLADRIVTEWKSWILRQGFA